MEKTLAEIGEFGLIHRLKKLIAELGIQREEVTLGIGDDTAAIQPRSGYELLITCDCLVEGRHFLPGHIRPRDLGRRAMSVNISDIGAMGGSPLFALVSLGLRADMFVDEIEELYRGFIDELNPLNASIIGGNITKVERDFFIDITLTGEVERDKLVLRSTAQVGDAILVTGYPGQAAAGLDILQHSDPEDILDDHPLVKAYVRPTHRARIGQTMASLGFVTAMIDISDGLLADLGHICQDSGKGADLQKENLPLSRELKQRALQLKLDPVELCLKDSDDYELIFTCSADKTDMVKKAVARLDTITVTEIGKITDTAGLLRLINPDGSGKRIEPTGWDHFNTQGEINDE